MKHHKALCAALIVTAIGAVSGCGTSTPTSPAVTQTSVQEPVTATQPPAPPSPTSDPVVVPAEPTTTSAPVYFRMPNLVVENLQLAQDKLQALGSYLVDQKDAAGLGRIQVNDSNWHVCTQEPAPGTKPPVETMVVLAAVKLSEQCP